MLCMWQDNASYFVRFAVLTAQPTHRGLYWVRSSVNTFSNHMGHIRACYERRIWKQVGVAYWRY